MNKQELITMSEGELKRIQIIANAANKKIKQKEAAKQLGLEKRQIIRLVKIYREQGEKGLLSTKRGKPSNRRHTDAFKDEIKRLVTTHYQDFGPSFAAEKLKELHQKTISKETLRQWMCEWHLWVAKPKKIKLHQTRDRRPRLGELVQIDGSPHDWFEGRRAKCCLLVFIDDATSQLLGLRFEETECSAGYFKLCQDTINQHGRPLAYYSDKWGGFRQNLPGREDELTQFGRVLENLDIELICANTPQAKGRVERANQTLQDRLVKELRLRGINDLETANAYLPEYIKAHNKKFAVLPTLSEDAHRKDVPNKATQTLIFSFQTERTISKQLEVSYKNRLFQIEHAGKGYRLQNKKVMVCESLDGAIHLLLAGTALPFKEHTQAKKAPSVVDGKTLNPVMDAMIEKKAHKPAENHPWRRYRITQARKAA